jgi:hypothetical protein
MEGTLHKTENGWVVKYYIMRESSHAIHPNEYTLPILDHGYVNGPGLSDSDEGLEVEFEVIEFPVPPTNGPLSNSISKYAQLIKQSPNYPEVKIICPRCKVIMPCECNTTRQTSLLNSIRDNSSWDTIFTEFHIATQQVEIGTPPLIFECWLVDNYNPPTKKQDNDKERI